MNFFFGGNADFTSSFGFPSPYQHSQQQQQQQPMQSNNKIVPPASQRILKSLTNVQITADDLVEDTNKECAICLEDQNIGCFAVKLHCGHMFCKECLKEWLEKHCTCPTCRFEVETDDPSYEQERIKRMKQRRPRFRSDELLSKRIDE